MAFTCPFNTSNIALEDFDCKWLLSNYNCSCPALTTDQDISGLGVVIAFVFSAILTLSASCAYFIIARWDNLESFFRDPRKYSIEMTQKHRLRSWDRSIQEHIPGAWESCMQSIVIGLSDQALATGLSLSISSLVLYNKGTIDKYSFCIASSLACLANGVHILSVILVRTEKKGEVSPKLDRILYLPFGRGQHIQVVIWAWRRFCMFASLAMFCAMFVIHLSPIEGPSGEVLHTCPARCSFTTAPNGRPTANHIAGPVMLFVCTLFAVVLVEGENNSFFPNILEHSPTWIRKWLHQVFAVSVFCVYFGLGLRILNFAITFKSLNQGGKYWGFGQIVSLVLLMLPIMAAAEAYQDNFNEAPSETHTESLESYEFGKVPLSSITQTHLIPPSDQTPPDSSSFRHEPYRSPRDDLNMSNGALGTESAEEARESQGLMSASQAYDPLGIAKQNTI